MWRPVLGPEASSRAWAAIETIERALAARPVVAASGTRRGPDLSLSGGEAGVALFLAYLDVARDGRAAGDLAFDSISRCVTGLGTARLSPMLSTGFTGLGWVLEHLAGSYFEADDDLSESIDDVLYTLLAEPTETPPFELLGGVVGLGTYLLERPLRPVVADTLERVVTVLESSAEESSAGVAWRTSPEWLTEERRRRMPAGCYDLGVAHGIPGVIGFLAAAWRRGLDDPRIRRLLEGAVRWLLAHRLPPPTDSAFADVHLPGQPAGQASTPARTAWCYGDPGIAAVLLAAGRSLGNPDWEDEALRLARLAARRPPAATRATDPGLCHGIAGLAHLFNRLFQATGDPELETATRAWYRRLLEPGGPGGDFAEILRWTESMPGGHSWREEPGLLVGLAGAGLALLAAVAPTEPGWDRVLLVSLPAGPQDRPFDRDPDRPVDRPGASASSAATRRADVPRPPTP